MDHITGTRQRLQRLNIDKFTALLFFSQKGLISDQRPMTDEQRRMTNDQRPMTNDQRETFLAAIARHRRASWRVTAACVVAVAGVSVVVAILMSPLLYCLIGLALDIVNFWRPMPDVLTWAVREVEALSNAK